MNRSALKAWFWVEAATRSFDGQIREVVLHGLRVIHAGHRRAGRFSRLAR